MIVFEKLRWKNFLSTGNSFTEIDFLRQPTTLIVGENGSGKSTCLDPFVLVCLINPLGTLTNHN